MLTLIQFGSRLGLRHARCTLHAPSRGTRAAVPFRFMAGFAWYKVSRRGSYTYVHRPTWRTYHLTSRVREEGAGLVIHTSIVRSLCFPSADLGPARIRTWFDATHRESSHLATQVRLSDLAASCTGPAHAPRTLHDAFAHASAPSLPPRTSHALLSLLLSSRCPCTRCCVVWSPNHALPLECLRPPAPSQTDGYSALSCAQEQAKDK